MNKIIKVFALGILALVPYMLYMAPALSLGSPEFNLFVNGQYTMPVWATVSLLTSVAIMVYVLYLIFKEPNE